MQGKAPRLLPGEEFTPVAVKMLKEDATDDMQVKQFSSLVLYCTAVLTCAAAGGL